MSIAQTTDKFTNNLRAVFTDKQISPNVTYTYVQNFKDTIGFRPLLEQHLQQYDSLKAPNSTYSIADTLRTINQDLLSLKAKSEGTKEIAADFDDSVITVFGSQERSDIGYNPKYHGRPSYKEKVGIISGTKIRVSGHRYKHRLHDYRRNI